VIQQGQVFKLNALTRVLAAELRGSGILVAPSQPRGPSAGRVHECPLTSRRARSEIGGASMPVVLVVVVRLRTNLAERRLVR